MRERLDQVRQQIKNIKIPKGIIPNSFGWYMFWIGIAEMVGITSGLLTGREIIAFAKMTIHKPPLYPNPLIFPLVWTIIYALMGISITRIFSKEPSGDRFLSIVLYFIQLVFNFIWCFIFFEGRNFGVALFWIFALLILVLMMTTTFDSVDKWAARLQTPYIIWLLFATVLNLSVYILNR